MKRFFLMAAFLVASSKTLFACSVCFGDPNSLQSKALGGAVLFLLAVIGGVLVSIAFLAITWSRRAKKLAQTTVS